MSKTEQQDYPLNEGRYAERRAQYLSGNHEELRKRQAKAIAFAELGYSASGVATMLKASESTIKQWFKEIDGKWGSHVLYPRTDKWKIEESLDDRSVLAPYSCPACRKKRLIGEHGISSSPYELEATRDESGGIWPVSPRGDKMLVHGEKVDRDESKPIFSYREAFLKNDSDLICLNCYWEGQIIEVRP